MRASFVFLSVGLLLTGLSSQEKPAPPAPLKFAPRDYFVTHCQRCHGVDGTNYTPGFAKKDTDAMLKADINRMADGPGNQKLQPDQVDVQIAYHRLMSDGKPFISWTGRDGLTLSGEVTDEAKLVAKVGDRSVDLKVDDDDHWKFTMASSSDLDHLELTATLGKKSTTVALAKSSFACLPKEPAKQ